jgi:hypothetical protein
LEHFSFSDGTFYFGAFSKMTGFYPDIYIESELQGDYWTKVVKKKNISSPDSSVTLRLSRL